MSAGRLIVVEGVEGAGKSTLLGTLANVCVGAGYEVLLTYEPGATELGQRLRQLLLHEADPVPRAELMLYLADRAEHVEREIRPALAAGTIVLCDRFTASTVAYQGYGRGLDLRAVHQACDFAAGLVPHRTYLLDLDAEVGLQRAHRRGEGLDRIEQATLDFHRRVRAGFLELAALSGGRTVVLDATRPADAVAAEAVADLTDWLP